MEHGLREVKSNFVPWPKQGDEIKIINPCHYHCLSPEEIKDYSYKFNFTSEDLWKNTGIGGPLPIIEPPKPKDYGVDGPGLLLIDFDVSNGFDMNNAWFFYKNIKIPARECMENYINKKRKREIEEIINYDKEIKNKKQKS